ncbi:uncharacterized protein MELLADRAFT_118146 [Melampsora larici-populina 98AG31]|uniref:Protein OS-9 homolog n=1 Tax=Melampsora larici-populina (strain 98AG31 / pathotype 3-4-7) TaxID=747676 RepID=F4S5K2_MELLP|nr:uncharacterized protein MELLADRAFT_118146 [Melampsora larici-populina 98AG31]EGG00093.1 hypothetical protein MELLADRAFT_118146 [Melampsora larici-populina 98AG31]
MKNSLPLLYLIHSIYHQPIQSLSSHSPQDLLAYPKYSVNLQDWNSAIVNSTAIHLLSNLTTSNQPDPTHGLTVLDTPDRSDEVPKTPIAYRQTLMRTTTGQAFLCAVPPIADSKPIIKRPKPVSELSKADDQLKRQAKAKAEQEGLKNGLVLLEALKDHCIYTRLGWFTYSFCYGQGEIRQFHAVMIPGHNHPHEDPTQDVFVLGLHVNHPQHPNHQAKVEGTLQAPTSLSSQGELTSLGRNRFSNTPLVTGLADTVTDDIAAAAAGQDLSGEGDGDEDELEQKRYLVQRWEGGTICDMTGKPRAVEVQFHCSTVGTDHIALLRETALCEYLLVIHTPRLCSEPLFLDGGGDRKASLGGSDDSGKIECRPILSDEDLEKWKTSETEKAKKKAAHDAALAQELEEKKHQKAIDEAALHSAQAALLEPQQSTQPAEESSSSESDENKSQPDPTSSEQIVLDGTNGPKTPADSSAKSSSDSKPTEAKSDTEDPGAVVMDPITVFFDTDTGQIYMDENGPQVRPRTATGGDTTGERVAGQATGSTGQPGRTPNRNILPGGNPAGGEGATPPTLEELTKALRESLGAVLRDLRDEGGAVAGAVGGAQARPARPLSELIAALQESSKIPTTKTRKSRKKSGSGSGGGKGTKKVKKTKGEELKEWKESGHGKMVSMYSNKFEVKEEDEKDEKSK